MKRFSITTLLIFTVAGFTCAQEKPVTKFLIPDQSIFAADFEDGNNPAKPLWQLRKSNWLIVDGVLEGKNNGGNGPFIRLMSKEKGGLLPEDYITKFSFKVEEDPQAEKKKNKYHPKLSSGNRFSFGHYAAKYQWNPVGGMDLNIGHGDAMEDDSFRIEKSRWYHVTAEIRGDEILVWFEGGPVYYMKHDHFRSKPSGWEFFTHMSEFGYLDNLQVWSLGDGEKKDWQKLRSEIMSQNRAFISDEHPDFKITKSK